MNTPIFRSFSVATAFEGKSHAALGFTVVILPGIVHKGHTSINRHLYQAYDRLFINARSGRGTTAETDY